MQSSKYWMIALCALPLTACAGPATTEQEITNIEDPFRFCAETGSSELIPESRTNGEFPAALGDAMAAQGLIASDAPPQVRQANQWRCMDGQVWVCPLGANLPCGEKADLSRDPAPALTSYCEDNPGSDIPAYVTGRATVYSWGCAGSAPEIQRQLFTPDAAGYLSEFWKQVSPP